MERIIDLSGKLEKGLWGYYSLPGLEGIIPHIEIKTVATVKSNGFFASKITVSSLSGTYLEAGSHIIEDGKNLDDYSVEDFIRPAKIIKLPEQKRKSLIDRKSLEQNTPEINRGEALLMDTGWGRMWNKPGYVLECPNMSRGALEWVLEQNVSIFGVDIPCIEAAWSEEKEGEKGSLLGTLFKKGMLLLAPLVNMDKITEREGKLICLPMYVKGTSGAPVRVIFIES